MGKEYQQTFLQNRYKNVNKDIEIYNIVKYKGNKN